MKAKAVIFALPIVLALSSVGHAQQQDACKEAVSTAKNQVNADYQQWINSLNGLPDQVKNAYIIVFNYNRDQTNLTADAMGQRCDQQFEVPQKVVDAIIAYYTLGLSRVLPQRVTHVDVSEIMHGHPLGGPNAAIPKFREQVLASVGAGGNGTGANILRDPWKCATFQRKC